nr:hypothetical protein [Tessaracoccus defluvii]
MPTLPLQPAEFHVFDTSLRDGAQQEGLHLSVTDKLRIAGYLDELGVTFIEGGWPGANPADTEFFQLAKGIGLQRSKLVAFGATRKAGGKASEDALTRALVEADTEYIAIVAKSHADHVERALRTTLEENLAMISDTVTFLRSQGRRVFVDAEHFFDGYRANPDYAIQVVRTAHEAGAEVVVLCDTNGGMLPSWIGGIVAAAAATGAQLGVHAHNDTACAVANTLAAVEAGVMHVQGTFNGYGERTGNADLSALIPNLQLKYGWDILPPGSWPTSRGWRTRSRWSPTSRCSGASPTSVSPASPTRRACTPRRSRSTRTSTSTSILRWSATTCGCSSPTWPVGPTSRSRVSSSGSTSTTVSSPPASPRSSRA